MNAAGSCGNRGLLFLGDNAQLCSWLELGGSRHAAELSWTQCRAAVKLGDDASPDSATAKNSEHE
jgi:hypothetical protein